MPSIVFFVFLFYISEAGHAPTWDSCNCHWETWRAWSQCSASCGGGYRYRSRRVWHTDVPRCDGFEKCASGDMGSDYDYSCNAICYHGSYSGGLCRCQTGWYGSCCNNQITCGNPGSLRHGFVEGSLYTYNSVVIYHCDNFYNLTGGTRTSRCQPNALWSGVKPRCAFANSCQSNPCQNNGTCINGLDRYRCECTKSFTGKNCEIDIQAPELAGCPENMTKFSSEAMTFLNWTAPTFTDPVGKPIQISTNYPRDSYTFPWGDFDVQYVALKPSNGMRTSCVFSIKIRPHPCKTLENPSNGAKVCNGWKTDYGEFCLAFCGPEYSLDITSSYLQWYVCGARGRWAPHEAMSNCTGTFIKDKTNDARFRFTNCSAPDQVEKMQETYLTMLQTSPYGYFCTKFENLCHKDNVIVSCE